MNVLISAINVLMETVGFVLTIGWMICAMTRLSSCLWSCLSIGARQVCCPLILLIIHFLWVFELEAPKLHVQPLSRDEQTKLSLFWSE